LLPDFELPNDASSVGIGPALLLKHRETRHLTAGAIEASPVFGSGEVGKTHRRLCYSPAEVFQVARRFADVLHPFIIADRNAFGNLRCRS
jgi:hypothetical protein